MKHVLITGGAGFVGSHLSDLFLSRGYAVTALDNFLTGRRENVAHLANDARFDLVEHDVSRPFDETKARLVREHGLHGVLHFACPASPKDFDTLPFEILEVDSVGTFNSVELALRHDCRYILASTSEVYGDPLVHPQREDYWGNVNSIGPRACYDEAKRFGEAVVSSAMSGRGKFRGQSYKPLQAGIVRIFNTYGPRMRPNDGRVVPELCIQGLNGRELTVHGDGLQTRSFCFVSDLADGILRLFESRVSVPVNIGNPVERTILDFAKEIQNLTQKGSQVRHSPARVDDPKQRCPDIARARELLGWSPRVDLTEGLSRTLDYFKNFL